MIGDAVKTGADLAGDVIRLSIRHIESQRWSMVPRWEMRASSMRAVSVISRLP
jgi:hypothetical protein